MASWFVCATGDFMQGQSTAHALSVRFVVIRAVLHAVLWYEKVCRSKSSMFAFT